MLSNRITAKSLELNPARQARKRMLNESKDCHPAGCVSPPDRPPLPPPPPAAPGRLFPCTEPPAFVDALCLPSLAACCSAISARSLGWICSCHALRLSLRSVLSCPSLGCARSFQVSYHLSPSGVGYNLIQCSYSESPPLHPETHTHAPHTGAATVNPLHDWTLVERGGRDARGGLWDDQAASHRSTGTRGRGYVG